MDLIKANDLVTFRGFVVRVISIDYATGSAVVQSRTIQGLGTAIVNVSQLRVPK